MSTASQTIPEAPGSDLLHSIDQLLRDAPGALQRIRDGRDLATLARAMIVTVAVGAGIFGASMGAYRGGLQILYAGIKLPLAMLLTTAVCAPALTALNSALGRQACIRRDLSLVLSSLARASLVVAAQAPLVLLAVRMGVSYHALILLVVACCTVAGALGLSLFLRGLRLAHTRSIAAVALTLLAVFGFVGTQMSWTLRPFVVRPRTPETPFVRPLEGSFFDAVVTSSMSARGVYWRESAPLPGEEDSP